MEKQQQPRSIVKDFINGALEGAIAFPLTMSLVFKNSVYSSEKFATRAQAFKDSFGTAKAWKLNAMAGAIWGVCWVGISMLQGHYKQRSATAPVAAPLVAEPVRSPLTEELPQASDHAQKEMTRREEAAEHEAQIA